MKTTRNKNYRPLNLQLVVEQAVCKQGSVLPMTQGAQLRSGDSDDARNFYITFLARSFVLRHMTVTSNEQGRRANDERRSCRSIVLSKSLTTLEVMSYYLVVHTGPGQEPVAKQILRRKWSWIGHTLRKPASSTTRQDLAWNPQGKRNRGRPRNSWRRDTEAELKQQGTNWSRMTRAARTECDGSGSLMAYAPLGALVISK